MLELALVFEPSLFTVCAGLSVPVLPEWLLSPLYIAVIASVPTANPLVTQVAIPGLPLNAVVPQPVFMLHVTPPVGANRTMPFLVRISPFSPVTVAVKVTVCPYTDGLVLEATVVVVLPALIVSLVVPVLLVKFVSPEYVPLKLCVPSASVVVVHVPVPPLKVTMHTAALPLLVSTTGTVPVGVPAPGADAATVAVMVTVAP